MPELINVLENASLDTTENRAELRARISQAHNRLLAVIKEATDNTISIFNSRTATPSQKTDAYNNLGVILQLVTLQGEGYIAVLEGCAEIVDWELYVKRAENTVKRYQLEALHERQQ